MCMDNESDIEVAKKDIICWKVIERKRGTFTSTLCRMYHPSEVIVWGLQKDEGFPKNNYRRETDERGFYAYCHIKDARRKRSFDPRCRLILKCLVPKGTRIIRGEQGFKEKALRAELQDLDGAINVIRWSGLLMSMATIMFNVVTIVSPFLEKREYQTARYLAKKGWSR